MECTTTKSKEAPFCNYSPDWFDDIVASLRSDQVQIETGLANKEKVEMYTSLMGNPSHAFQQISNAVTQEYISSMLSKFNKEILSRKISPVSIHASLTGNTLNIWAVINDDDLDSESGIYLSEAKINSEFSSLGYRIDCVILEKSDNYTTPPHFVQLF